MDDLNNRKTLCDIANFAFDIVSDWLNSDQQLASDLRSSQTSSRQFVGEETITTDLAGKLRTRFPQHIEIKLFTHPEEKETGADWYWRIERGSYAIHAYVQAKRVQRTAFAQQDDQGYIDINHSQLERLLLATRASAQRISGLEAWLATYARINAIAIPPCGCDNLQECRYHRHAEICQPNHPALWIANAHEIANSGLRRPSVQEVVRHSLRLDCVLPCIEHTGDSGPAEKGFVLKSGLPSFEACVGIIENDSQLYTEIKGALLIRQ